MPCPSGAALHCTAFWCPLHPFKSPIQVTHSSLAPLQALAQPGAKSTLARFLQRWFSVSFLLVCNAVFSLLVLLNLLGSVWWAIAVAEGLENSWAASIQGSVPLGSRSPASAVAFLEAACVRISGGKPVQPWPACSQRRAAASGCWPWARC